MIYMQTDIVAITGSDSAIVKTHIAYSDRHQY